MEVMDSKQRFYVNYQDSRLKIQKSKDEYKLIAVSKTNGKSKTLFKGSKEDCQQNKDWIDEAYQKGCLFYYFE